MNKLELQLERQEKIKPATIRLEIFRHDDKGGNTTANPDDEIDKIIPLSKEGRVHASEIGTGKDPHPEVAIAYGSLRNRTVETAERQMLAGEDLITKDSSLEEINELIADNISVGKKHRTTELLDFNYNGNQKFRETANDRFTNKKDLLIWHLEESDRMVEENKDKISSSYSRLAGNVAELVSKYSNGYSRWKKIVNDNPDKYSQFNNEMQRFMGTHQGVGESFLMKVIEKTLGKDEVYNFINSLESKNGFKFGEGYSLVIGETKDENNNCLKQITINFNGQQFVCDENVLKEIIADRDILDKKLQPSK